MERLTFDNNGVPQFTHEGMIMYCSSMAMADCVYELENRLSAYEDAEEQGRLVMLPCKAREVVWVYYPKYKEIERIAYMTKSEILEDIEHGAIICKTREEAELAKEEGAAK